ncbi:hypothetical protein, partial [Bartonella sp. AA33NXGY]|uniref:hypothetical protein n=1 Tax=Bartonella sp. AA33NXGY TaxID=3243433 RepID=UPI0035D0E002
NIKEAINKHKILSIHNVFKKIRKNIKKDKILFDNKYVFCYINNQVLKTLKHQAGRLRNNLSHIKKLTIFYAVISIYENFVGCGHAIQNPMGKACRRT